jgi:SAM-dependent methyltransferase
MNVGENIGKKVLIEVDIIRSDNGDIWTSIGYLRSGLPCFPVPSPDAIQPNMNKIVLDACCGGRQFWFQKKHPKTLYIDNRIMPPKIVGHGKNGRVKSCLPDEVMDFRKMSFKDDTFKLVVFDPPHIFFGATSVFAQNYGRLERETWREDLKQGFSECFRVLQPEGILIFKWNEWDIPLKEVLKLTPYKPLFGHPSGKAQKTHWVCFMKEGI